MLVVGAGGLGSPAALYLAAAGCGTLGLVDYDRVELSNLQRQVLFDTDALGRGRRPRPARERLARSESATIRVVAHAARASGRQRARARSREYDLVLDGTDRLATRYLVNDACVIAWQTAGVGGDPPLRRPAARPTCPGSGPCYRCLFPHVRDGLVANCAEAGVLGVLPGVLGTLQATEAIKLITGGRRAVARPAAHLRCARDALRGVSRRPPARLRRVRRRTDHHRAARSAAAGRMLSRGRAPPVTGRRSSMLLRRRTARHRCSSTCARSYEFAPDICRARCNIPLARAAATPRRRSRNSRRRCSSAAAADAASRPASSRLRARRCLSRRNLEGGLSRLGARDRSGAARRLRRAPRRRRR